VCRGSLEDVVGVVSVSRLLALGMNDPTRLESIATPALFVPETLSGMELLEQFRERTGRMVFVVDEYGVVQGLMTPHDLLEAITGELRPGVPADAWATLRDDGAWELDGTMPISELKARLDIRDLPEEDRGRYNTVAGLLMSVSGHLPAAGEHIECGDWMFEVVSLEGKRIDRILARQPATAGAAANAS
jgi:putative hemolysin